MTTVESNLETKLTQLDINVKKTNVVIESQNSEAIERHLQTLKAVSDTVNHLRLEVEAKKIESKVNSDTIQTWNDDVDSKLQAADVEIGRIRKWVRDREKETEINAKKEQLQFEEEIQRMKLQLKADQLAKTKSQNEEAGQGLSSCGVQAKLPKLVITKFDGSHMDWPRFWGQFSENIDKTSVAPITKFTYLRELVTPQVSRTIEALPFTAEGYNRAKSILKEKFGKDSEIIKAYTKEILELPTLTGTNPKAISDFSDKLTYCVQALQTLNKLEQVNGATLMTLDKLPGIRGDLVRTDPEWEKWDFAKLSEAIRLWIRRNPVDTKSNERDSGERRNQKWDRSRKLYQARGQDFNPKECVYCGDVSHKPSNCQKITKIEERRATLAQKNLCFNCATPNHRAAECFSKATCQHCKKRHHTSICDRNLTPKDGRKDKNTLMTANGSNEGILPIIPIKVDGITCRALIDTGAGSSYASGKLIDLLKKKPSETKTRRVDMLISSQVAKLEVYDTLVESLDGDFSMSVKLTKVHKGELLTVHNPHYQQLIDSYSHLRGVNIEDLDSKEELPVHVVLGSGEYARIKTETKPHIGRDGEPIAEKTKLGWFIMSPGQEFDRNRMMLTQTSQTDYEELCRLDVLGLADSSEHDQLAVYREFKEQLVRNEEGWYETGLPWRGNHPPLPSNKQGSLRRLTNLNKKLERHGLTAEYDQIIREQNQQGIIENCPLEPTGTEFYIPHKPVIREEAASTKLRVVYDASARAHASAPSLNECLYPGPPLQNKLWDVLVRQRFHPVAIFGDIQKAFLQIRIKENERDALRFHWRTNEHSNLETLRFTRALFGLTCSPFLLGGVIDQHLQSWESELPEVVAALRKSLYVDDLLNGGETAEEARKRKSTAIEVFGDAKFVLHKWNSNVAELEETHGTENVDSELSFAKQQLGAQTSESKVLGLLWNKQLDTLTVTFPQEETPATKRELLKKLAKVYDPLGLTTPFTLQGKLIYRDICNQKLPWDAQLTRNLTERVKKWEQTLPTGVTVPRPVMNFREPVLSLELHAFGDASTQGVGAAVYAVIQQLSGTTQRLVAARGRLAKQGLTVPRLELISAHMATNLVINLKNALNDLPSPRVYAWLDSTVALHWIGGNGEYKQFVSNRVEKIHQRPEIEWRHVPTHDNPADLASRGGGITSLWLNGPEWLSNKKNWPPNPVTSASAATEEEAKVIREVLKTSQTKDSADVMDQLLERHDLRRALRVNAWVARFIRNCRGRQKLSGPLSKSEIDNVRRRWILLVQQRDKLKPHYEHTQKALNLQTNASGLLECHGRIQGRYPIYLPTKAVFTRKLVQKVHCETLHGGVGLTMAAVREQYWVPKLRSLAKSVRSECHGCKRFTATPVTAPAPGPLPEDRTAVGAAFEVVGVDFAGPIRYKQNKKSEKKAYLTIFTCSLSRAVHLELLPNLETEKFIACLKRFIARRGRPRVVYSDNGGTFIKTSKWLRQLRKDERLQGLLDEYEINWKFNLSRAPWWGGHFERLIGVVKSAMYKVIGGGVLTWDELSEVLLDVETQINRRPLSYVEDDVELPVLTPSSFLFQRTNQIPEQDTWRIGDPDLRKRAKYLKTCKENLWKRWKREYLAALRERHNLTHKEVKFKPKVGDVVIIKTDNKNRGTWPLAIVSATFPGRDGIIRAVELKTTHGTIERPVQHLYPLEISCDKDTVRDTSKDTISVQLNPSAAEFRSRRDAAVAARTRIQELNEFELD